MNMREWFRKLLGPYGPETRKVQLGFFFGSWAVLAAVGLFIPEKVLSENEWAWRFSDFMASFIPQIDRITALNLRPEVNKFHYSILWAVSPLYCAVFLNWIFKEASTETTTRTYSQACIALFGTMLFAGFAMFLWGFNAPNNSVERIMFMHPITRGITAPILVFGFCASLAGFTVTIWRFLTGRFHRTPRSEAHGG